jgi:hypothetical protein
LSVEADQPSAMLVAVRELALTFVGTEGVCVSAQADVEPTIVDFGDRLPAASYASTSNVYAVPHVKPETEVLVCVIVAPATPLR